MHSGRDGKKEYFRQGCHGHLYSRQQKYQSGLGPFRSQYTSKAKCHQSLNAVSLKREFTFSNWPPSKDNASWEPLGVSAVWDTPENSKGSRAILRWVVKEEQAFKPRFHCRPGKQILFSNFPQSAVKVREVRWPDLCWQGRAQLYPTPTPTPTPLLPLTLHKASLDQQPQK